MIVYHKLKFLSGPNDLKRGEKTPETIHVLVHNPQKAMKTFKKLVRLLKNIIVIL